MPIEALLPNLPANIIYDSNIAFDNQAFLNALLNYPQQITEDETLLVEDTRGQIVGVDIVGIFESYLTNNEKPTVESILNSLPETVKIYLTSSDKPNAESISATIQTISSSMQLNENVQIEARINFISKESDRFYFGYFHLYQVINDTQEVEYELSEVKEFSGSMVTDNSRKFTSLDEAVSALTIEINAVEANGGQLGNRFFYTDRNGNQQIYISPYGAAVADQSMVTVITTHNNIDTAQFGLNFGLGEGRNTDSPNQLPHAYANYVRDRINMNIYLRNLNNQLNGLIQMTNFQSSESRHDILPNE